MDLESEIPGLASGRPLGLVAMGRREWVTFESTPRKVAKAAAAWAEAFPQVEWVFLSNLNMNLEGPFRALDPRPANLYIVPPLPYPVWRAALEKAAVVVTDSHGIAAEALERRVGVAALGEIEPHGTATAWGNLHAVVPSTLVSDSTLDFMRSRIESFSASSAPPPPEPTR